MRVYTYYEHIPGFELQEVLLDRWSASWEKNGFEPIVLTIKDAKKHPQYQSLLKQIQQIRNSINIREYPERGEKYSVACYVRWLAFASIKSPERFYLSDYDIINFNFKPGDEQSDKFHLMDHFCPGIVSATATQCEEFIQAFLKMSIDRQDELKHLAKKNKMWWYNDQDFVEHNMDHLEEYGYDWKISPRGTYSVYPSIDTTPNDNLCLVHFDHGHTHECCKQAGKEKFYLNNNRERCRLALIDALFTDRTIRSVVSNLK